MERNIGEKDRRQENEAVRIKRSRELPHIPDFAFQLAEGEISNIVEKHNAEIGQDPTPEQQDEKLAKYLSAFYDDRKIKEILRRLKQEGADELSHIPEQLSFSGMPERSKIRETLKRPVKKRTAKLNHNSNQFDLPFDQKQVA